MRKLFVSIGFLMLAASCTAAFAQQYAEKLQACMVSSIDTTEKVTLFRWLHSVMSSHPELSSRQLYSESELADVDRSVAFILTKLLTQSCKLEAAAVIQNDPHGLRKSFGFLMKFASDDLMDNSQVQRRSQQVSRFIDSDKIDREIRK